MDINEDIKKELTKKAEIEHEETPENPDIFSAEKDIIKGKFIGDKSVRIRRPVMKGIKKVEQGTYEITAPVKSKSFLGRIVNKAMLFLIGKPLRTADEVHERLTKIKGLAVFASDCISSSAYAPEEILRALMLAGT